MVPAFTFGLHGWKPTLAKCCRFRWPCAGEIWKSLAADCRIRTLEAVVQGIWKTGQTCGYGRRWSVFKKAFTYVTIALLCLKIIKANLSGLTSKNISL